MSVSMRLSVAAVCAVALIATGVALERHGPAAESAGAPAEPISGAWSCPHGGGEGWRVWVTVTNPGSEPVEIRVTTAAGGAASPPSASVIEPSTLRYVEVGAPLAGSATVVEYLGGAVAVGSVVVPPHGGLAAEPCVANPGSVWHLAEASTLRGEAANLVVHNPFATQAVVDVILTRSADPDGAVRQIRHDRLQGVVLGAFQARAFELNNYALGEAALGGTVIAVQGRVAVASVVVSAGGIRSSLAVADPATTWFLPGLGAETDIVVRALPDGDAPVSAEFHSGEGPVPALDLEAVSAGTAEGFGFLSGEGALLVQSDGPRPMIAGRRMVLEAEPAPAPDQEEEKPPRDKRGRDRGGRKGAGDDRGDPKGDRKGDQKQEEEPAPAPAADLAATSGAAASADRWLVPPPSGPEAQPSVLLLHNPGDQEVTASVTMLGQSGVVGTPTTVQVPARSTVTLEVEGGPVSALVEGAGLIAAQATLAPHAFAVVLGAPV